MVSEWVAPTVISSAIAGGVALATHFSAQAAKSKESREDMRTEAFDQAKSFYTDTIERQDKELQDMRAQVREAVKRASAAEDAAEVCRAAVRALNKELEKRDGRIRELEAEARGRP